MARRGPAGKAEEDPSCPAASPASIASTAPAGSPKPAEAATLALGTLMDQATHDGAAPCPKRARRPMPELTLPLSFVIPGPPPATMAIRPPVTLRMHQWVCSGSASAAAFFPAS
mgnify:CR=1 FL=1